MSLRPEKPPTTPLRGPPTPKRSSFTEMTVSIPDIDDSSSDFMTPPLQSASYPTTPTSTHFRLPPSHSGPPSSVLSPQRRGSVATPLFSPGRISRQLSLRRNSSASTLITDDDWTTMCVIENDDLLHLIFGFLPARELVKCRLVSERWNSIASLDTLWREKIPACLTKWGFHPPGKLTWYESYIQMHPAIIKEFESQEDLEEEARAQLAEPGLQGDLLFARAVEAAKEGLTQALWEYALFLWIDNEYRFYERAERVYRAFLEAEEDSFMGLCCYGWYLEECQANVEKAMEQYTKARNLREQAGDSPPEWPIFKDGVAWLQDGKYKPSLAMLKMCAAICCHFGNTTLRLFVEANIGTVFENLFQFAEARQHYRSSLFLSQELEDRASEMRALAHIGNVENHLCNYTTAIENFEASLQLAIHIRSKAGETNAVNNLGCVHQALCNNREALIFFRRALELAQESEDKSAEANALGNVGTVYYVLGNYDAAIEHYEKQLNIGRNVLQNKNSWSNALTGLGNSYQCLSQYERALGYHMESLEVCQEVGDKRGEALTHGNIGNIYACWSTYDRALEHHDKNLKACREIGHKHGESVALANIGEIYCYLANWEKASESLTNGLQLAEVIGARDVSGFILRLLGVIDMYTGVCEESGQLRCFTRHQRALDIAQEIEEKQLESLALRSLGDDLRSLNKVEESEEYLRKSLEIAVQIRDRFVETDTQLSLAETLHGQGEEEEAIDLLEKSLDVKKRIGDRRGVGNCWRVYGTILVMKGDEQGWEMLSQALTTASEVGDACSECRILFVQGVYKGDNDLVRASHQKATSIRDMQCLKQITERLLQK